MPIDIKVRETEFGRPSSQNVAPVLPQGRGLRGKLVLDQLFTAIAQLCYLQTTAGGRVASCTELKKQP